MLQEDSQNHFDNLSTINDELVSRSRSSPSGQLQWSTQQSRCSSQVISELNDLRAQTAKFRSELYEERDRNAQLILELDELRDEKAEDSRYWERLYQKTRKRGNYLKRRNKDMQAEYGIGQDQASEMNLTLRSEKGLLQEKVDSYKDTLQFKEPFLGEFQAENMRKVLEHVDSLFSKLHKVLQGHDVLFAIEKLDNIKGPDISALFKRAFGLETSVDDTGRRIIPTTDICRIKLQSVVLSLVATALCTWVFEAEVGALFQQNNIAYEKLQSLLAEQGR